MKKFKLEVVFDENAEGNKLAVNSVNDGFNGIELYGFLTWKANDVLSQITGDIKPDKVTRQFVEDGEKKDEPLKKSPE